ncbi:trypsin-like peptidase domain-containing protein [Bradyrhizobium sp. 83002]|uniref:S1 family peptidase n=1 Tax=Bradyrhizobium aeschynomenes TaxID=2734909 RepID=UPI001557A92F|nr:serine protease [Bradyrhizobium aeschynomenes]NPU14700.1 trypsin-like peptidase domain-containing protein [Bradyrhizobium aeschynomenes]
MITAFVRTLRALLWRSALVAALCSLGMSSISSPVAAQGLPGADTVYASAPPRLLQIRTLVADAGRQTSTGSGFLVSADGLAITNYHVVSDAALEPKTYRLEYTGADGTQGAVTLLAVDLPNDLALVRVDKQDAPFFAFDKAALDGSVPKGERLYSLGNPLDLGFTIIEGTYNGLVEHSYNDHIHFTGALNPGMSGGPAVNAQGQVVGVNVATRRGGQLISFLVPARFAAALLARGRDAKPAAGDLRKDVSAQLANWRGALYKSLGDEGFRDRVFGSYQAPETRAVWFECWASTNASASPKPRASINATSCKAEASVYVASDLNTGVVEVSHSYAKSIDLNQFQFATVLTQLAQPRLTMGGSFRKWYTPQRCHEDFVGLAPAAEHPPLRVMWCAQGYREFDLYDVVLVAVTQDRADEALVSRLNLQAVAYDDALRLGKSFLERLQVAR